MLRNRPNGSFINRTRPIGARRNDRYPGPVDLGEPIREHEVMPSVEPIPVEEPAEQDTPVEADPVEVPA